MAVKHVAFVDYWAKRLKELENTGMSIRELEMARVEAYQAWYAKPDYTKEMMMIEKWCSQD